MTTFIPARKRRLVLHDFELEVPAAGLTARVPAGYDDFDGASIPRFLWTLIGHPYMPVYERAALIHDYLYDSPQARALPWCADKLTTRLQIDRFFQQVLLQDGVRTARARAMFRAVNKWGAKHFTQADGTGRLAQPVDEDELTRAAKAEVEELRVAASMLVRKRAGTAHIKRAVMRRDPSAWKEPDDEPDDPETVEYLAEFDWSRI